jgi:hypothetical protein
VEHREGDLVHRLEVPAPHHHRRLLVAAEPHHRRLGVARQLRQGEGLASLDLGAGGDAQACSDEPVPQTKSAPSPSPQMAGSLSSGSRAVWGTSVDGVT